MEHEKVFVTRKRKISTTAKDCTKSLYRQSQDRRKLIKRENFCLTVYKVPKTFQIFTFIYLWKINQYLWKTFQQNSLMFCLTWHWITSLLLRTTRSCRNGTPWEKFQKQEKFSIVISFFLFAIFNFLFYPLFKSRAVNSTLKSSLSQPWLELFKFCVNFSSSSITEINISLTIRHITASYIAFKVRLEMRKRKNFSREISAKRVTRTFFNTLLYHYLP